MPTPIQSVPLVNGVPAASVLTAAQILAAGGVVASGSLGLRNRVTNGDMRIDQANAGAVLAVNNTGPFNSVDKWRAFGSLAAGIFNLQQLSATPPPGYNNYLRATVATADAAPAAGNSYCFWQAIEGYYVQDFQLGVAANTVSIALGFWIRTSVIGTFSGSLRNSAGNRSYPFSIAVPVANTWTFITLAIPSDSSGAWLTGTNIGLYVFIDLGSGANFTGAAGVWAATGSRGVTGATSLMATLGATLDFTGVQLEIGPNSTPFEQVPFPAMLERCQREFQKSFLQATAPVQNAGANTGEQQFAAGAAAAAGALAYTELVVVMRAAPAVTLFNPQAANAQVRDQTGAVDCSASAVANNSERGFLTTTTGNVATVVGNRLAFHYTADARL